MSVFDRLRAVVASNDDQGLQTEMIGFSHGYVIGMLFSHLSIGAQREIVRQLRAGRPEAFEEPEGEEPS